MFGLNSKFVGGQTKAEPFNLMTEMRREMNEQKFNHRMEQLRMQQLKDCTFKPNINQRVVN